MERDNANLKILFLTNIPSPYRVNFFNELGKYTDLTVIFERSFSSERDSSWKNYSIKNFRAILLHGCLVGNDKAVGVDVIKYIKKNMYDAIIVSNPMTPTGVIAISYMRLKNIPFIIEGDGALIKKESRVKHNFKKFLLCKAMAALATSEEHVKYYTMYGVSEKNIFRYHFSSVFKKDVIDSEQLRDRRKKKEKLDIPYDKAIVAVGSYTYRKGFDVLIEASRHIDNDVGIYIIGGIPSGDMMKTKEQYNLSNVHYLDYMVKKDLVNYYLAADIFVLPTREDIWGLVINEAMANGLPVITTEKCFAGIEMVTNDWNGYIVPVDDSDSLANKINEVLRDNQRLIKMSTHSLEVANEYTIENMVMDHLIILANLLKK